MRIRFLGLLLWIVAIVACQPDAVDAGAPNDEPHSAGEEAPADESAAPAAVPEADGRADGHALDDERHPVGEGDRTNERPATGAESDSNSDGDANGNDDGASESGDHRLADPTNHAPLDLELTAEHCTIEGHTFVGSSTMETIGDLEVFHGRLWVVDGDANVRRFIIDRSEGCRLSLDTAFGTDGVLNLERDADMISSGGDTLVVSSGLFEAHVFGADGAERYVCEDSSLGNVYVHPTGQWALASFMRSSLHRVTFTDTSCDVERDAVDVPAFRSVQRLAFIAGQTLLGGTLAEPYENRYPTIVGSIRGDELAWRHGAISMRFDPGGYGYVHAIEPCGGHFCILDANMRRLQVVRADGTGWQTVDIADVLSLRYPWLEDMDSDVDGTVFIVAAQASEDDGTIEGSIAVLTGF